MNKQELLTLGKNYGIQHGYVKKIILKKTELSKEQFFLLDEVGLGEEDLKELKESFKKLSFGYPIEYILEQAEFYGLVFYVDKRCLIPRDDTEVMVDEAIKSIEQYNKVTYIDVGTGSGAIAISIIDNSKQKIKNSFALDISDKALEVTKINIKKHILVDKIIVKQSDLLENITRDLEKLSCKNTVITANLPYIKDNDFGNMDAEVILHEPPVALYGGKKTGFELYEKLIQQIISLLKEAVLENCILFIEIGFDQKEVAKSYLEVKNLEFKIYRDNNGVERCIKIIF